FTTGSPYTASALIDPKILVPAFTVRSDGSILIAGGVFQYDDPVWHTPVEYTVLEKLDSHGNLDTTFNPNGPQPGTVTADLGVNEESTTGFGAYDHFSQPFAVAVQPDTGDILVGGWVTAQHGGDAGFVARFHPDGSLDTTFGAGGEVVLVKSGTFSDVLPAIGPAAVPFDIPPLPGLDSYPFETAVMGLTAQADG